MKRLLSIAMLATFGAAANAQDFVNGSFETADFTGWTVQQGNSNLDLSGANFVGMDGQILVVFEGGGPTGSPSAISQTLSVAPGQYVLSFAACVNINPVILSAENLEVTQNGADIFNGPLPYVDNGSGPELVAYSFQVTMTGNDTFAFAGTTTEPETNDILFDNVHLTPAVPEPAPMLALGLGVAGLAIRRRRS